MYDVKVTVDPTRKQYDAVLTNTNTGQTFSRSGMNAIPRTRADIYTSGG